MLTIQEFFTEADHTEAQRLCRKIGRGDNCAYSSTSDLTGLYCLPKNRHQRTIVICKTAEFGMVAIETFED